MIRRSILLIIVLLFGFNRVEAGDIYPSQVSKDGLAKITLLYVGVSHDTQTWQPFVVIFLVENRRSKEEIRKNPGFFSFQNNPRVYPSGSIPLYGPPFGINGGGSYDDKSPILQKIYSLKDLPEADDRYDTERYDYYYKWVPKGPLQVVFMKLDGKTPEITFDHIKPSE